ncbi:MAG: TIGR03905 family TSCPD domain-containing protein [Oscillospiraceae bacterium]|nr:TIGR03905 family TSCPD domain-containing protein [Oscillospiraceae bacterium]
MPSYIFKPKGVCASEITFELTGGSGNTPIVSKVNIAGGCSGNTRGISSLVEGMQANEATRKLEGIVCGKRGTSCPDQLAKAIKSVLE